MTISNHLVDYFANILDGASAFFSQVFLAGKETTIIVRNICERQVD
jgi:hypothetical protein